jgi:hypothetical protein
MCICVYNSVKIVRIIYKSMTIIYLNMNEEFSFVLNATLNMMKTRN